MTFIQTISFSSGRMEEMQKLMERWDQDRSEPAPGSRGIKILKDRDSENAYMVIAEFENYELAMENSNRPETDAFAKAMGELTDGPMIYGNYDLLSEQ
jgi:quinol monooxygenase YgiN